MSEPQSFPEPQVYDHGLLDVGHDNRIYWEARGNPDGRPALVVHGGPGSGRPRGAHKGFHPDHFQVVVFDQRGCGDSQPSAADPTTDMAHNTTEHLLADMEALRQHLGIEHWLLYGGSWASTLILAYAERHPERVIGIVLVGVTMTRPKKSTGSITDYACCSRSNGTASARACPTTTATATSSRPIGS